MSYLVPPHYYQSVNYARYAAACGFKIKEFGQPDRRLFVLCKKIPLFGTVAKLPKVCVPSDMLDEIAAWAKAEKLISINLDPSFGNFTDNETAQRFIQTGLLTPLDLDMRAVLSESNFLRQGNYYYESFNRFIKLPTTGKSLLPSFKRARLRTQIRQAKRQGLTVKNSKDIDKFVSFFAQNTKRRRALRYFDYAQIKLFWKYFAKDAGTHAHIVFVCQETDLQAAVFVIIHRQTGYYRLAAMSANGEKTHAAKLAAFAAMKLAQSHHCTLFDFGGTRDPARSDQKDWAGFTHFKTGFGGAEFQYERPLTWYNRNLQGRLLKLLKL